MKSRSTMVITHIRLGPSMFNRHVRQPTFARHNASKFQLRISSSSRVTVNQRRQYHRADRLPLQKRAGEFPRGLYARVRRPSRFDTVFLTPTTTTDIIPTWPLQHPTTMLKMGSKLHDSNLDSLPAYHEASRR